jgi:hypothetical protein
VRTFLSSRHIPEVVSAGMVRRPRPQNKQS